MGDISRENGEKKGNIFLFYCIIQAIKKEWVK